MSIFKLAPAIIIVLGSAAFASDKPATQAREHMEADARGNSAETVVVESAYEDHYAAPVKEAADLREEETPVNVSYPPDAERTTVVSTPAEQSTWRSDSTDQGTKPAVKARLQMEQGD